ncbi:hypothetical protein QJS66_14740 [Kocuria rhizophila]|nr:hypothetical protein QJS66_14740 [Kocuria rhizophila]
MVDEASASLGGSRRESGEAAGREGAACGRDPLALGPLPAHRADAALSSPSGQAVAVHEDGSVAGVVPATPRRAPSRTSAPPVRTGAEAVNWLTNNWPAVLELAGSHLVQSVIPVLVGLLISVPLRGCSWQPVVATRVRHGLLRRSTPFPSLTLFVVLPRSWARRSPPWSTWSWR